ncbi:RPAP1-like protein [Phyllosticta citribraziliensis]|uniref:RPAP1-like protein n=1 Tax=Phyllosticta citribraziliensis TaxID=989973 RepID=A0ABR1L3U8_9PEZI
MSTISKGDRFHLNFDDPERGLLGDRVDPDSDHAADDIPVAALSAFSFIGDVQERAAKAPSAPSMKATPTGFPAHKKRTRVSAFKKQRSHRPSQDADGATPHAPAPAPAPVQKSPSPPAPQNEETFDETERRRIDEENRQCLAEMTPDEIEAERQELFANLNPKFLERMLQRANLDQGSNETNFTPPTDATTQQQEPSRKRDPAAPKKKVAFAEEEPLETPMAPKPATVVDEADEETQSAPSISTIQENSMPPTPSIHFPQPPQPPTLDPNSPNFLEDLHAKYFPNLPADPSSLSWAAPLPTPDSAADRASPYHPSLSTLDAADIRFDFNGAMVPPRAARALPVTLGLHHHGAAPEAAGYTVPELALLARSAVPAQRCMAIQTLGRLLYRLGRGEFGVEGTIEVDGPEVLNEGYEEQLEAQNGRDLADLARGLWEQVDEHRVVETLSEEVNRRSGHLTAKACAEEALWLWRKGGGRKKRAV